MGMSPVKTAPFENGDTECEMRLGLDDSEVTLSVRDPEGAASEETMPCCPSYRPSSRCHCESFNGRSVLFRSTH